MERATGFYWVNYEGNWLIGWFNHYDKEEQQYWWELPESWDVGDLDDRDFDEINEKVIIR